MKTLTRRARALLAVTVLLALVVGVPVLLWALAGNPVPDQLPSLDEVRTTLSMPDYTGAILVGVLKYLGWAAWAVFAWAVVAETIAALAHRPAPRLPGMGGTHRLAAALVAAALLGSGAQAAQAQATPPVALHTVSTSAQTANLEPSADPAPQEAAPTVTADVVVVAKGDSLWSLAEQHLGDGRRWKEIWALNADREMPGGHVLTRPEWIDPGWELYIPSDAPPAAEDPQPERAETTYTVQPGDTLSKVAKDQLGDPDRFPEIFDASTSTVQPGGYQLVDPDQIDVGWQLTIPGTVTAPGDDESHSLDDADRADREAVPPDADEEVDSVPDGGEAGLVPPAEPRTAATEPPSAVPTGPPSADAQADEETTDESTDENTADPAPAWLLPGLAVGGGAALAAGLFLGWRSLRRAQWRHRKPGQTMAPPPPDLLPVEKTLTTVGAGLAPTVETLDTALRHLAGTVAAKGGTMPELVGVTLSPTGTVAQLAGPAALPPPWRPGTSPAVWHLPAGTHLDPAEEYQPAPYPLLVTVGAKDDGTICLFNIEDFAVTVTGDAQGAADFTRHLVAQMATNPWADYTQVDCVGVADELAGINPDRLRFHARGIGDPVADVLADAVTTIDRAAATGIDAATGRVTQAGGESWAPHVLVVDAHDDPTLNTLVQTVADHPATTATSVIITGPHPAAETTTVQITADGRALIPDVGLDVTAVGLTAHEAAGCAALLAHADATEPVPVPVDPDAQGWRAFADQAGSLRPEHTHPRTPDPHTDVQVTTSVLPEADLTYLTAGATTSEDLQAVAPEVTPQTAAAVTDTDPTLDDDVAAWFADQVTLPRLRLLGPVKAWTRGTPLTKRKPYYTELLAYLALHPAGATAEQVADAFSLQTGRVREYMRTVRTWLGTNPRTGQPHLPDARTSPAAAERGTPAYQVLDLLVDLDLFRRLRVRAQTRGPDGTADLITALRLVSGPPFGDQRRDGWAWLCDDRHDEYARVAVVDVAHTVVHAALPAGDLRTARLAVEIARLVAPHDEIPRVDLAAVAAAEGNQAEAAHIINDQVITRTDDHDPPPQLSDRTRTVLATRPTLTRAS